MTDELLSLEDLTIKYKTASGDLTAVSNASFTIGENEYFGLVGESGCGKSTIAHSIPKNLDENGFIASGKVKYRGDEIQDWPRKKISKELIWNEISYIPQSSMNSLDPLETIQHQAIEIANVHSDMGTSEVLDRLKLTFEKVGLNPERIDEYPHQFSGGMQQRAIIALALMLDPSLIIADEPTTALDVITQDQVLKYIDELGKELGVSILLITHDIAVVMETCQRMAVMHSGQIAEQGTVENIFEDPKHPYTILLQESFPDIRQPKKELEVIPGAPPQIIGDVDRCAFSDRCPWAEKECTEGEPQMTAVNNQDKSAHSVGCYRSEEIPSLRVDDQINNGITENTYND